jgi:hypothetical protein
MKKYTIIFVIIAVISSFLYSCHRIVNNCKTSTEPEAKDILARAQDNVFSYPAGFYVEETPTAETCFNYCGCANSVTEADAYFDYSNTVNARNYTVLSERETNKYYERTWNITPSFRERTFKCSYFEWDCYTGMPTLKSVTSAGVKEFSEYWLLNEQCYPDYTYNVNDILSSEINEDATNYISTIEYFYFFHAVDWDMCDGANVDELVTAVNKTGGTVTMRVNKFIKSYYTGSGFGSM